MTVFPDEQELPRAKLERQDAHSYGVHGAMTFDSVTDLWRQGDAIFSDHSVVEIDLAGVTRTDSAGLALLVEWLREAARQGGRIKFLNFPAQMLALAGAANLEQVLMGKQGVARP